ncbi:hypothetical protein FOE78_06130 [Microlunatus elymi]|uniref:Uncharacterized protein n=1 Tax=Microlunatus elymi TaxID=2596828 RepID=A0A516PWK4_9ACTN|nr:hypothetical protein [Microlunatus elymi]QDP95540.1 hypothetical protein FOE78_06130 [Microlunatus elymi]
MSSVLPPHIPATRTGDPYFVGQLARQQIDQLHADAEVRRLIKDYRQAHPEAGLRGLAARGLRRVADRLAPSTPTARRIRSGHAHRPALSLPTHGR